MSLPPNVSAESSAPQVLHTAPASGALPVPGSQAASPIANGQTSLPRARRGKRNIGFLITIVIFVVGLGAAGAWAAFFRGAQARTDLAITKVEFRDLQRKVIERGTLDAKEKRDIKCEVKAGSRGAAKIKWVVENGTMAKAGDLLVEIDDSFLVEQEQAKDIDVARAETDKINAAKTYPQKKIAVDLAKQQLEQWVKGDFPQQLHEIEGNIQTNESAVLQQEDRTAWAARMVKKGYMTASQEEAEQANLTGNKLTLQKFQEQKKVLVEYTDPVKRQTLINAIEQAKADELIAKANMNSTQKVFDQQKALYDDLVTQKKQCKVTSSYDGIVVYYVPEQTRTGSGSSQSIIAQGEPVQAGQTMMSIPDLSHMLVKVRIHEAFINDMKTGLETKVRVDAVPGKTLKAHVKYVANVAAQQDWMSPDVKVYDCVVEIDDYLAELKLKPGLSAVCTIFTDRRAEHVLAVPVQAVLGSLEKGGKPYCFVLTPNGPQMREVELGMADEKYIEIKNGLNEGDDLILNPRTLVSDKDKKRARADDRTSPTDEAKPEGQGRPGKGRPSGTPGGKGKPGDVPTLEQE
jgi:HlyD family secretion protein